MPTPDGPQFKFFHGTTSRFNPGDEILPPSRRSNRIRPLYTATDPDYSYATEDQDTAWQWAEAAWHHSQDEAPRPRVFGVAPMGEVEEDPLYDAHGQSRGTFASDRRSRSGWKVLGEVQMPEHIGTPEEWEDNKQ
jgi:hypothetical protein